MYWLTSLNWWQSPTKNPLVYSNPLHALDAVQLTPHAMCDDVYVAERRVAPPNFRPSFVGTNDPCKTSAKFAKKRVYPSSNGIGVVVVVVVVIAVVIVVVVVVATVGSVATTLSPANNPL